MEINRVMAIIDDADNREDQESERRKCKKTKPEKDNLFRRQPMELVLGIRRAVDIDDDDPVVKGRVYCALYWIEPDQVYHTRAVQTVSNDPVWNELDYLPVQDYFPGKYGFLNVEVARLCSDTDPATSSGTVIVGRVRVPLPRTPYCTIEDRFKLARLTGEGHMCLAGEIFLLMKIKRAGSHQQPDHMINYQ